MNTKFAHAGFAGRMGVARIDITPPPGIYARNWGASSYDVAEGVHRPLTLTALTFQQERDAEPLVLVAMDGPWWKTHEDEWRVRRGLLEGLSLNPVRVMLHLSHTHAGSSLSVQDQDKPGGQLIAPYLDSIREAATQATRLALESADLSTLSWAQGKCTLAQNRGFPDPDRERVLCGFNPQAPADDTLVVGRVTDARGNYVATLVNYACHPTTLAWANRLISPDYIGAMRGVVESHTLGAPCIFLQGASGDLAPREQYTGDTAVADAHGRQLGHATVSVLEGMLPPGSELQYAEPVESGAPLATWRYAVHEVSRTLGAVCSEVELPLKELPTIEEIETELQTCADRLLAERLRRQRETRRIVGNGKSMRERVWVWRVGSAFFAGQANEAFSWLQIELRRQFPQYTVAVLNLVNGGEAGYLPTASVYGKNMYEVNQSPFARGCLELVRESTARAIEQLSSASTATAQ